ncbi:MULTISPECIES: serine hydrolase [unclassified Anaeromyxobacter]|uniref:serine hydrolase domain-containing protein n=1 Tax=unclassified Anaeromyxobacter TaxID=2620896 RepID=UPI001F5A6B69|nr:MULTISPECIES: serine hydrolase domain-containing protein [unclassified Anaeromyxobacter]
MRAFAAGLLFFFAVPPLAQASAPQRPAPASTAPTAPTDGAPAAPAPQRLSADGPKTTVGGNPFLAPAGWSLVVRGPATVLEAPEGDSWLALVDVAASDAEAAVAAAWKAYRPGARWPLKVAADLPDKDGWSRRRDFAYQTSPNERRVVFASARFSAGGWTVVIGDLSQPVAEKRRGQIVLVLGRLLPKGYARESFAGKKAEPIDAPRLAELRRFVERAMQAMKVPGVGLGIVQGGKVVFAGGLGVRKLGDTAPVDGDTLFMIASNTKALTTLLLAKEVDEKRLTWATPVTSVLPGFALGDADTSRRVLIKHLVCACTGMPRQDMEWLLEFGDLTPAKALAELATMQPTSRFGELFQYSNPLAAAAGFTAGHVLFPGMELGAAYDRAMQEQVFGPLGMTATTFDFRRALAGAHADAHAPDVDGRPAQAVMDVNRSIIPLRPAGAAWSSVRDLLRYVQMELDEGTLPGGAPYVGKGPLLDRRTPQVTIGKDVTYGMGLAVDTTYGVPVVHHGGDMIGYHSDMIWLPGQAVGAVILTNGDPGWALRDVFRRKLLEVLFDGRPEADAQATAAAKTFFDELAAERKLLTVPADTVESARLARRYASPALGSIAVIRSGAATVFDFGEWRSEVASRRNPDGTLSFLTTAPGVQGLEFVVGRGAGGKRALTVRDAQHEYPFIEE